MSKKLWVLLTLLTIIAASGISFFVLTRNQKPDTPQPQKNDPQQTESSGVVVVYFTEKLDASETFRLLDKIALPEKSYTIQPDGMSVAVEMKKTKLKSVKELRKKLSGDDRILEVEEILVPAQ